jgi:hypothetical protein
MARDNDRNRISAVGVSDGARRGRPADALGELGVSNRCAEGNSDQFSPNTLLKFGADEFQRDIEVLPVTAKVFGKLLANRDEWHVRLLPRRFRAQPASVLRHEQSGDESPVTSDEQLAQRGINVSEICSDHWQCS